MTRYELGQDIRAVEDVLHRLERQRAALDSVGGRVLDAQLTLARAWRGPDARRHERTCRQAADRSREAAQTVATMVTVLRREVEEQEQASGGDAGPSGAPGAPPATGPDDGASTPTTPSAPTADPGPTPSPTDFSGTSRGTLAQDAVVLAQAAYPGYSGDLAGYREVGADELGALGITPDLLEGDRSGFAAAVFVDPGGQYVVSFRGTEHLFTPWEDPRDDIANVQGAVGSTEQSRQAAALTMALAAQVGVAHVLTTGHSLGGRNAAIGAIAAGTRAITFNAAGVSNVDLGRALALGGDPVSPWDLGLTQLTLGYFDGLADERASVDDRVTNYRLDRDPLSMLQEARVPPVSLGPVALPNPLAVLDFATPEAVGAQVVVDDPTADGIDHELPAIIRGLEAGTTNAGDGGGVG